MTLVIITLVINCALAEVQTFVESILLKNAHAPQKQPAAKEVANAIDVDDNFMELWS